MLMLEAYQTCQYSINCPYNKNQTCQGSYPSRDTKFTCNYVDPRTGTFCENGVCRNPLDVTGHMNVLMES